MDLSIHPFVIKLEPLLAIGLNERVVVAAMDAAAVHQHAVQLVQIAHRPISVL